VAFEKRKKHEGVVIARERQLLLKQSENVAATLVKLQTKTQKRKKKKGHRL
jgi:hypothetical protein